jgi:1-acyl-sn-glycerol-3-phosphate acyltransferase
MVRWLAEKLIRLRGWHFTGEEPPFPKFVAVGAPHTSNWDFMIFLAVVSHFKIPARVIGKSSLVRWPFGNLMRRLGIIPIDRDSAHGLVEQMVDEFEQSERMAVVIAPEGTRGAAKHWRSGFYRIAVAANVPIVMSFIDAENRIAGLGPTLHPSGEITSDMDQLRAFYSGIKGRHPERQGPIVLREELQ